MVTASAFALLAARSLIAGVFVFSAVLKFKRDPNDREAIDHLHLPFPDQLMMLTAVCEIIGAAMLLTGVEARLAAIMLALFLLSVTLLFLRFWTLPSGIARFGAQNMFYTNFGLLGGLIYIAVSGPGPLALLAQV